MSSAGVLYSPHRYSISLVSAVTILAAHVSLHWYNDPFIHITTMLIFGPRTDDCGVLPGKVYDRAAHGVLSSHSP